MSCTRRASGETCSSPQRAGRTCCCRWLPGGVAGGQVGTAEPGQWAALTAPLPASPGQPDEHHVPGAGAPGARARAPGAAAAGGGEWSWLAPSMAQKRPKGARTVVPTHVGKWSRSRTGLTPRSLLRLPVGSAPSPRCLPLPAPSRALLCVFAQFPLRLLSSSFSRSSESLLTLETWLLPPSCRLACLSLRCLLKNSSYCLRISRLQLVLCLP